MAEDGKTCSNHGKIQAEFEAMCDDMEEMKANQIDLRKAGGVLSGVYDKIDAISKQAAHYMDETASSLKWFVGVALGIFIAMIAIPIYGAFSYTSAVEEKVQAVCDKVDKNKERLDATVLTKDDLEKIERKIEALSTLIRNGRN